MHLVSPALNSASVCIISDPVSLDKAKQWADYLNCPVINSDLHPESLDKYFFRAYFVENKVFVLDAQKRKLEIDFDRNHIDYHRKGHRGKSEMIAKALGAAKGCQRILDLSVGLGVDSVFLSQIGFSVCGVERSPMLYMLLSEAFASTEKKALQSYKLYHSDALDFLSYPENLEGIDSIYFDPMYPHKKKKALPKQEMIVFRDLVGDDGDAVKVLELALKSTVRRVVVKRPMHAEELLPGVAHSFEGKVVRYDTYVVG